MRISEEQLKAAYQAGRSVYDGEQSITEAAAASLVQTHDFNQSSANDLVRNFQKLLAGDRYTRTLSTRCTELYLQGIERDYGAAALRCAITSVEKHLEYYSELTGAKLRGIREMLPRFIESADNGASLLMEHAHFERRVAKSAQDTRAARRKRLKVADKNPKKYSVDTEVLTRNPDVVAEVLERAGGVCESCGQDAPFRRASDGTPYLEVHHKTQLACKRSRYR